MKRRFSVPRTGVKEHQLRQKTRIVKQLLLYLIFTFSSLAYIYSQNDSCKLYLSINAIKRNAIVNIGIIDSLNTKTYKIENNVLVFDSGFPAKKSFDITIKYNKYFLVFKDVYNLFENYDLEFLIKTKGFKGYKKSSKIDYSYYLKWYPRLTDQQIEQAKTKGNLYSVYRTKEIIKYK